MSYLLDTHIWLWVAFEPERLAAVVLQHLKQRSCSVSVASIWEVQIKSALGKLPLPIPLTELVARTEGTFAILPVIKQHALMLAQLPLHHRDPFDRMLMAQALTEQLQLVTVDEQLRQYDVPLYWAK